MKRESAPWLIAAGVVAAVVLTIVVVFGITNPPDFPSLYDGGPTVEATVAYVDYGRDECVHLLDVATGASRELYCDDWLWIEGWDDDGDLRVQSGGGIDRVSVINPDTGAVIASSDFSGKPPPYVETLRATSHDGHATLVYTGDATEVTLIDVAGPRGYGFGRYGITDDGEYAWVSDSADRLLLVGLDGSNGPWLVADNVPEATWRG
jgi:hypothetical protein